MNTAKTGAPLRGDPEEAARLQEDIARLLSKLDLLEGRPVCLDEDLGLGPCRRFGDDQSTWCDACLQAGRTLP